MSPVTFLGVPIPAPEFAGAGKRYRFRSKTASRVVEGRSQKIHLNSLHRAQSIHYTIPNKANFQIQ